MSKIVIHACPPRMKYIEQYLVPSLINQGISNNEIKICCDVNGAGNLTSCMQVFSSMKDVGGAWHLQDDVIICRDFFDRIKTLESKYGDKVICGYCWEKDPNVGVTEKAANVDTIEVVPSHMWWSFPCIYIPNVIANKCERWFNSTAVYDEKYITYLVTKQCDDYFFREFLRIYYGDNKIAVHTFPCLVDHIDYLIGGSQVKSINRPVETHAAWFPDGDLIKELKNKLNICEEGDNKLTMDKNDELITKETNNKVAVYTGTRNLYQHMIPALKSLIANSDVDKIWLLIEDDKFPYDIPAEISHIVETKNMSNQQFIIADNPNQRSHFTYMAMIRVAFTKIFPELDKILSLDVDTICTKDISDIWNLPIDNYCIAACHEPDRTTDEVIYTNAGVCLQNLDLLRSMGMDDIMINRLNTEEHKFLDQDVQNLCLQNYILDMPSMYNVNAYCEPTKDPRIIHYAGFPRWFDKKEYIKYLNMEWRDVIILHNAKIKLHRHRV